ncbi:alpha/beta fold hydrolase [Amycolatopsis saalfeldensis]|uniref:Pimeloyl-ACP methyl ester carboxylesterase n=1 Tax=Amycolatopsis saalfeldensis TaxID=394193 RepID=A0A1H8XDB9_9PSEU|nr:alpha/beta hydrolase [Amycolatopsis saalfeldensis]SEP37920.1 Pimeloyl-ACP methyl ester carboxylesterase [Amycolatopsis saalfeldensis]
MPDHQVPTTLDPGAGLSESFVRLPDGRRLRTVTGGAGDGPLVLFEAGMSGPAAEWTHTQREIGTRARTLSYDRAGYGGSDDDPADRTLARIVDDLTALLDQLGETAPVVLAGHSWGGPIIRLFADRHPDRVAAMAFVDGTIAEYFTEKLVKVTALSFRVLAFAFRFTGKNLKRRIAVPKGLSPDISNDDIDILLRDYACHRAMHTGSRECAHLMAALPVMKRIQANGTPPVPTVYLQAGRVDRGMAKTRPLWNRVAGELADAAPTAEYVLVPETGHLIPQERPEAVREAIFGLLDRL